jgi:hypothetical protein
VFGNVTVYHNNFIDNVSAEAASEFGYVIWDQGYPAGGNHWSGWTGPDLHSGPAQDEEGADGIVDLPFGNDRYPFAESNGWVPSNIPPVADAGAHLTGPGLSPYPGEVFTLDATGSYDPDGTIVRYDWLLDDGTTLVDSVDGSTDGVFDGLTTHSYKDPGSFHTVTLTVTDDDEAIDIDTTTVQIFGFDEGAVWLMTIIEEYELPKGPENALLAKLRTAVDALEQGNDALAIESLLDLKGQLNADGFCETQASPEMCSDVETRVARLLNALREFQP